MRFDLKTWSGIATALFVFLLVPVYWARYDLIGWWVLPQEDIRPAEHRVCTEPDASMTTSDGIVLRADIYRPCALARAPTILVRIPFSRGWKNELGSGAIAHFWAARGYNVAVQGTRGRFRSEGKFYPLRHERQDGIETLAWLARQPWFDGRFGMWGGSAFGHTQWAIADQANPKPLAFAIQIASTSFREMFHQGGAFALESALYWAVRSHGPSDVWPDQKALERGFSGWPLIEADDRAVRDVPFFNDWVLHAKRDAYWLAIDADDRARSIQAPVLLMAGWYDPFLPTQLRDFETILREADPHVGKSSRLIVGPWTHAGEIRFPDGTAGPAYRPASVFSSLRWFDHHLLGRPLEGPLTAPVLIYVLGENKWRAEQEWPLARARETALYLAGSGTGPAPSKDGRLTFKRPADREPPRTYTYDPRNPVPSRGGPMLGNRAGTYPQNDVETRADVLVFTSEPLIEVLEVTGPVRAVLHVATTAPSTDFTVKLVDVHPDGKAYNVTDGILRRTYHRSQAAVSTEIVVELNPTSMLFRKGHSIRIEISSSNYPRFDRNPNTGGTIALETNPVPATQTLFLGGDTASRIILPVVPP